MRTRNTLEQKVTLTVGVREGAGVLGVCEATLRSAIAAGEIPAFKIGKTIKIPRAALERLLEVE